MLDFMSEVVTLSRPEKFGSFVVRLTTNSVENGTANGQRMRREIEAKILTHFAEAVRGKNGIRLQVRILICLSPLMLDEADGLVHECNESEERMNQSKQI